MTQVYVTIKRLVDADELFKDRFLFTLRCRMSKVSTSRYHFLHQLVSAPSPDIPSHRDRLRSWSAKGRVQLSSHQSPSPRPYCLSCNRPDGLYLLASIWAGGLGSCESKIWWIMTFGFYFKIMVLF